MALDPMFDLSDDENEVTGLVEEVNAVTKPPPDGVSRRQFIKRSATGAIGAVAAGAALSSDGLISSAEGKNQGATKFNKKKPNILIIMTDQERNPQYWPEGWADANLPNRKRLADKGLSFNRAFCNTAMCSPSRTTLFTGLYPAQHGVEHTLTKGGSLSQEEPTLQVTTQNMARMLESAGYNVQYRGKWHLSKDVTCLTDASTAEDLAKFGFNGWLPPDGGQDVEVENFGGGAADHDRRWAQQAADFLRSKEAQNDQPFALIVSFVNPHDTLAYPKSWNAQSGNAQVGYNSNYATTAPDCFNQGIQLPPTHDERLHENFKPTAQVQLKVLTAGLGPLSEEEKLNYVNFYAYLHKVVDEHIGTVLDALESRKGVHKKTVVFRLSDHGEMGMSHGGLRQKAFNAYEETLNVPLVISNPQYFPNPVKTDALASLVDVMPTIATLCRVPNPDAWDFKGKDLTPIMQDAMQNPGNPKAQVQDSVLFTYDDDNPSRPDPQNIVTQPRNIRCVRDERYKFTIYFDPFNVEPPQSELYDLWNDSQELHNMANPENTAYYNPELIEIMRQKLLNKMEETGCNFQPSSSYQPPVEELVAQ
jgi:arylsulfatase A-like enzyme